MYLLSNNNNIIVSWADLFNTYARWKDQGAWDEAILIG